MDKIERSLLLGPPKRRTRSSFLLFCLFWAVLVFLGIVVLSFARDALGTVSAVSSFFFYAMILCCFIGESLYAGVFGTSYKRQGKAMWLVAILSLGPLFTLYSATTIYKMDGMTNAIITGALGISICVLVLAHRLWRYRREAREAEQPETN